MRGGGGRVGGGVAVLAAGSVFMVGLVLRCQEKGHLGFVLSEENWREEEQGVTE